MTTELADGYIQAESATSGIADFLVKLVAKQIRFCTKLSDNAQECKDLYANCLDKLVPKMIDALSYRKHGTERVDDAVKKAKSKRAYKLWKVTNENKN